MKKLFSVVVVAVALFGLFAGALSPAFADSQTPEATVELLGGNLTITPKAIDLGQVNLDGTTKIAAIEHTAALAELPAALVWNVNDATGHGYGWDATIVATDFQNGTRSIPAANFSMQLRSAYIAKADASAGVLPTPQGSFGSQYMPIDSVQSFLAADVEEGMGSFNFAPEFKLVVPASAYAGTYTSTVTVTVTENPAP